MTTIQRSYRLRVYPSAEQAALFARWFGCGRWAWNTALALRESLYRSEKSSITGIGFSRELTWLKAIDSYAWLAEVPRTIYTQKLADFDRAWKNFFDKRAKRPKFKKKHKTQSVRLQLDGRVADSFFVPGQLLRLPGMKEGLDVRWTRAPGGTPKMLTLIRETNGRYFITFMVEELHEPLPQKPTGVGIDASVRHMGVTDEGELLADLRKLRHLERRIRHAQRTLARKERRSANRERARLYLAKLYARQSDLRQELVHQASHRLIRDHGFIALEDLSVAGMTTSAKGTVENPGRMVRQKAGLNRSILNAAFGMLRRTLEYKAAWNERIVWPIDRWAASSKTCSCCGHRLAELPLRQRRWVCPGCGVEHDRDVNAARNILRWATEGFQEARQGLVELRVESDTFPRPRRLDRPR